MSEIEPPLLVFVGGFLGAGKTTLITAAGARLVECGMRVAIITNDQDHELVDTKVAQSKGFQAGEVVGGCFCCKLSDLLDTADDLLAYQPHVIFAEPVGSCIDLSATLLQPLKAYHSIRFRIAPLTVLVDPALTGKVYAGDADADTAYLFRNQIAEADLIAVTKSDLFQDTPLLPVPVDVRLSGKTGDGVNDWLDEIMYGGRVAGARLLDVDYDRYADAEAALGWLNLHAQVDLQSAESPATLVGPFLDTLDRSLSGADIRIAHLKVFARNAFGYIKASIVANGASVLPEGDLLAEPSTHHELAINLRAVGPPETLRELVAAALNGIGGSVRVTHSASFHPARPQPELRLTSVVA